MAARGGGGVAGKPPRSSVASSRYSIAADHVAPAKSTVSRRSSVVYGKGTQARTDPRPINDKAFQTASMRRLVEYLTTHGYSFPISPKLLPSGRDIHNMIEFLFRQVDPSYRLVKLEDDVPLFFRMLGYPFQISKSALYAAGSPHSWPNLLGALAWLVDLYNCHEVGESAKLEAAERESMTAPLSSISDYVTHSYAYFMQGDDDACNSLDEEMRMQISEQSEEARQKAEHVAQQITELETKLQLMKSEPSPLVALETKKAMLLSDVGKFNTLIQSLTAHKGSLEKKVEQHKQQLESRKADLAKIIEENQALAQRVASQTVNVEDFEKMTRELQRVEEELRTASTIRKEKEKETWDLEVLASKTLKKLDGIALECNHAMRRLKLASPSGNPFEIHLNPRGETAYDMIGIDIKKAIRPQLAALQEDMDKNVREKWKESTDLLKEISSKEDALQEKRVLNAQLEAKMKELETLHKKHQDKLESIQNAIQKIRVEDDEAEEKLKALELESAERYERAKKELEETEVACENEIQHAAAKLLAVFEDVAGYVERTQAKNAALRTEVGQLKIMVNNNFIRKHKQSQSMALLTQGESLS